MASSTNVSALLKQLSSASQTLSEASNKLTEQIKEIEANLASYNLGVVAWVELRRTPEEIAPNTPYVYRVDRLGYSKKNGKWALYASSAIDEIEHFESWLLRDAPRELRLLAVDAIPNLLEAMVIKAKELTADVTSKTDRAKSLAHSLRNKPKKGE
jgi:hypothetical protein